MPTDFEKAFGALEQMRRARLAFETRVCEASLTQAEDVLDDLRLDSLYDYAEFFFTIEAMDLKGPDDIGLLADLHNQRIADLCRDKPALRRRGLSEDRLLKAMFTVDTRPRLEQIWKDAPGALDQSNLARFLVTQISSQTVRKLTIACEKAGFVEQSQTAFNSKAILSTGIIEKIFAQCMLDMQSGIAKL